MIADVFQEDGRSTSRVSESVPGRGRIAAIDMTKGVLVMLMVVYHSFNYSTSPWLGFVYLPFVPFAFILITGFLISYLSRQKREARKGYSLRSCLRGLRLLVIFTLLNLGARTIGWHKMDGDSQGLSNFFSQWFEIYVDGTAGAASFIVLLPIAYLLIFAPFLVVLDRSSRFALPILLGVLFSYAASLNKGEDLTPNLSLLMAGILGIVLGRISGESLRASGSYCFLAVTAYAGYAASVRSPGQTAIINLLGAALALCAVFSCCVRAGERGFLQERLIAVGKYSLLGYMVQIGLLQVLTRLLGRYEPYSSPFFVEMIAVALCMTLISETLEWARIKARWIDTSYRLVFA